MRNGDEYQSSISQANHGQLVKMLITPQPEPVSSPFKLTNLKDVWSVA